MDMLTLGQALTRRQIIAHTVQALIMLLKTGFIIQNIYMNDSHCQHWMNSAFECNYPMLTQQ